MGTLAAALAGRKIRTTEDRYWADVEGAIEDVDGILKITRMNVLYHLKTPKGTREDAKEAFSSYITACPAAQTVKDCIDITHDMRIEEMSE